MSADTRISCTQPTRPSPKSLTHNALQKPGVGRHHTNLHSADTLPLRELPIKSPTALPTSLPTYLPSFLPTFIPSYLHSYLEDYQHNYQQNLPIASKTIQRLLYLQRCGPWSIPTRTNTDQQGPRSHTRPDRGSENENNKTNIKL